MFRHSTLPKAHPAVTGIKNPLKPGERRTVDDQSFSAFWERFHDVAKWHGHVPVGRIRGIPARVVKPELVDGRRDDFQ